VTIESAKLRPQFGRQQPTGLHLRSRLPLQNSQQFGRAPLRRTLNLYSHNSVKTATTIRPVTVEQRARLLELGSRLEDVWYSPHVDSRLKQQVVRLLIEHATVDINDSGDEVVLWLKWSSGHHTELRSARRRRRLGRSRDKIRSLIETLRKIADDLTISRTLNRVGVLTPENKSWTQQRVLQFRKRERIAAFSEKTKEREGWLTQAETATYLSISPMSVNRLIQQEIISAEGEPQFPRVIHRTSLASDAVQAAIRRVKTHGNSPLPKNPQQQTLFFKD
jgi:hypothetical protein